MSRWTRLATSCELPCLIALARASRKAIKIQCRVSSGRSYGSKSLPQRCCAISMFSNRLDRDIRMGPVSLEVLDESFTSCSMSPADLKPENEKRQTENDSQTTRPFGAFHRFPFLAFPDSRE